MTKCCKFINKTMGNIKSQLKEAIKSRLLIGLVSPLLSFSKSNGTKKSSELMRSVCARP